MKLLPTAVAVAAFLVATSGFAANAVVVTSLYGTVDVKAGKSPSVWTVDDAVDWLHEMGPMFLQVQYSVCQQAWWHACAHLTHGLLHERRPLPADPGLVW